MGRALGKIDYDSIFSNGSSPKMNVETNLNPLGVSRWLTRLQAFGFGILLLLLIEGFFWLLGFGETELELDPFVGFSSLDSLFVVNPFANRYETRFEREPFFVSDNFTRIKNPETFRIFVFGGSTVQGRPYSIKTAFPQWLKINLELAYPDLNFEVVNCGGISYASYRLVPIVKECLSYQPDLFVLCTGQNEFLEARSYRGVKWIAGPLAGPVKAMRHLATYHAMEGLYNKIAPADDDEVFAKKPTMKLEVDALLDYKRGIEAYHRDLDWRGGVIAHFEENIRRIHGLAKEANVPLVILNPPVNLKDCPPFKSEYDETLSETDRERCEEWLREAGDLRGEHPDKAASLLERVIGLDPQYAQAHYLLGRCRLALNDLEGAEDSFRKALDEDVCPLRLITPLRAFVQKYTSQKRIPYMDLEPLLQQAVNTPILGMEILVDHVHPSIYGHQLIGEALADGIINHFIGSPPEEGWEAGREAAYSTQTASLEPEYFARGDRRLHNLMLWTRGESDGLPIELHKTLD